MELSENKRRVKFEDYVSEELKKKSEVKARNNARNRARRKREMDELRNQFGGKCKNCGSKKKLEFAHILPTELCGTKHGKGRGSDRRIFDIKNNPSSYVLLCSICHMKIGDTPEMKLYHKQLQLKRRETYTEKTCQFMLAFDKRMIKWLEEKAKKDSSLKLKNKLEKKRLDLEEFENFMKSKNYSLGK